MMAVNRRRGEISAMFDGKARRLCLTLGALAELEDAFAAEDISSLVQRFSAGRLSARDIIRIIAAGLRGGGNPVTDDEVAAMSCDGGAAGFATVVGDLLSATFGSAESPPAGDAAANP